MIARLLHVLLIDDQQRFDIRQYEPFLHVMQIVDPLDVASFLVSDDLPSDRPPVDLFLIDVNMALNARSHGDLNWGMKDTSVVPYGPILALPFLNSSRVSQFVPYSEKWSHEEVSTNGYVALALSLILSVTDGVALPMLDVWRKIKSEGLKLPRDALTRGLQDFRKRLTLLSRQGIIQFRGIAETRTMLSQVLDEGCTDSQRLSSLEVAWTTDDLQDVRIHLKSIFADRFSFNLKHDDVTLARVLAEISKDAALLGWEKRSVDGRMLDDAELANACAEILLQCALYKRIPSSGTGSKRARAGSNTRTRRRYVDVLETVLDSHINAYGGNRYQLKRTTLLFAWVAAWQLAKHVTNIQPWDSVRSTFFKEGDQSQVHSRYKMYLAKDRSTVSYELFRTPFRQVDPKNTNFVLDSYTFIDDGNSTLHPRDLHLCREFARDHLAKFRRELDLNERSITSGELAVLDEDCKRSGLSSISQRDRVYFDWMGEGSISKTCYPAWMTSRVALTRNIQKSSAARKRRKKT